MGWDLHTIYDVRLPNICFDDNNNAVLIDLDRCDSVESSALLMKGCMYKKFGPQEHDWLQLGWLAH